MSPLCEARSISVHFGGVRALNEVSLQVREGELVGLIGPNGAGKSTLFDVLAGATHPSGGDVFLDGATVTARPALWRARHGVRRTFQRQQMFGSLTVEDNVRAAAEWQRAGARAHRLMTAAKIEARVDAALEMCGLQAARHVQAGRLAIGPVRMVELARAIVTPPRLLLLDEPTSGLDDVERTRLLDVLSVVRTTVGSAVVLVEHDVPFVLGSCERIVVLSLGRVLADGPPEEVRANADVLASYLGAPRLGRHG